MNLREQLLKHTNDTEKLRKKLHDEEVANQRKKIQDSLFKAAANGKTETEVQIISVFDEVLEWFKTQGVSCKRFSWCSFKFYW